MNSTDDTLIQQAIEAGKAGDKETAKKLLSQVVRQDPDNARAWYLLSQVVDNEEQAIYCLEKALEIDPQNSRVAERLQQIKGKSGDNQPEQVPQKKQAEEKKKPNIMLIGIASIAGLGILCIIGLLVMNTLGLLGSRMQVAEQLIESEVPQVTSVKTEEAPQNPTEQLPTKPPASPIAETKSSTPLSRELSSTIDPRLFVLTANDLLADYEFVTGMSGFSSNEAVADNNENPSAYLQQLQGWGRVNGYNAIYQKQGTIQSRIRSQVIVLQSSEGAQAYFNDICNQRTSDGWTLISTPTLGEEANAYSNVSIFGLILEVNFRERNIIATITLSGPPDQIVPDDVVRYAQIMDSRIVDNPPESNLSFLPNITPKAEPTDTPTLTSAPTPTPQVIEQSQTLGPIWDSIHDESYSTSITVHSVRYSFGEEYNAPRHDYVYAIVELTINNLGPSPIRSIGPYDFQVLDANGALRDEEYISESRDCRLDLVDLSPGGSISGCVGFEVPVNGKLELIYAPYQYEGLEPGRYLSFVIRQ